MYREQRAALEVYSLRLSGRTCWGSPRALAVDVGVVGVGDGDDRGHSERYTRAAAETGRGSNNQCVHTLSVKARPCLYLRSRDSYRSRRSNKERSHGPNVLSDVIPLLLSPLGEADGQERAKAATLAERKSVALQGAAVVNLRGGAQRVRNGPHFSVDHRHCFLSGLQAYQLLPYPSEG